MVRQSALVTGSSDRIGKAIALHLAQLGYDLILHYNKSEEKAKALGKEIMKLGVNAEVLKVDFTDENNFDDIFKELASRTQLDILVNNASDFLPSGFDGEGASLLNHHLKVNFESAYLLTKYFSKYFLNGLIINILDTKTEKNTTIHLDYLLSKRLLKEFTYISAYNLAPGFRVNGISPGLILPPKDKGEEYLLKLSEGVPLRTTGDIEQIQEAVGFFVKNDFVTGQIIYVNGGEHL